MQAIKIRTKVNQPIEYGDWCNRKSLILKRDWKRFNGIDTPKTKKCPFCGHRHIHGGSDGHRGAHCGHPIRTCIADDGTVLSSENGYIIVDINK